MLLERKKIIITTLQLSHVGKEGPGFLFSIFLKSRVRVTSSKSVGLQ